MDLRKIRKLIELLEESTLAEMEIESGEERIALRRAGAQQAGAAPAFAPVPVGAPTQAEAPPETEQSSAEQDAELGLPVTSPIVGTFYTAASPGAPPFVADGQKVAKGDVLCIVEAMKMMNEIKSPHSGTVTSIQVGNAHVVEYGQVLMYIKED